MVFKLEVNGHVLTCERIYESKLIDRYQVSITRSIVIQSNRPELRAQNKNSHKFKWKLHKGGKRNIKEDFLKNLFAAIEYWIENIEEGGFKARQEYMSHKPGDPQIKKKSR